MNKLEQLFKEYNLYDKAIICSFFPSVIYQIKNKDAKILTGKIFIILKIFLGITWRRWFSSYADLECKIPRSNSIYITFLATIFDIM